MSDKDTNDQKLENGVPNGEPADRVIRELFVPLQKRTGAMIGWGIFCIVLGTLGLIAPIAFSVGVTIFIGAMLLVSGATGLALFWKAQGWGARTGALILSLLTCITGLLLMFYPIFGVETLTLFLASYFIAVGLVKCWVALSNTDAKGWGLMLLSAIISLLLGGCLWWGWPQSSAWIFGIFVAIELIFDGWTVLMIGLEVRAFTKDKKQ